MATTAQQAAADWVAGLSAKTQRIQTGVQSVTTAPGQAAARQKNVWVQNVTQSADKWATRVQQVSLQDWQASMVNKGIPRIASGAQAAQSKFENFMGQFLPFVERGKASLPPRGTFEQNVQRATAWMQYAHTFKRSGS